MKIKDYLYSKNMTFQSVYHLKQMEGFFPFKQKTVSFLKHSFLLILAVSRTSKAVSSWLVSAHGTWEGPHFWVYLVNHYSLGYEIWSANRYNEERYFSEVLWIILRTGTFQALFKLPTCSNYLVTNDPKFSIFHFS